MDRRAFVTALSSFGALPLAAATTDKTTRFYAFHHFKLKYGSQLPHLHEFLSQSFLPALSRIHSGPQIYLEAQLSSHIPLVTTIYGFSSLEEMWSVHGKASADESVQKSSAALEAGPEGAFESLDISIVEAADYSPEIKSEAAASPRIFELRVYHSPTWHQLAALHERFRGAEIKIFHRSGIHPVLYGSTFIGGNIPNLVYLIPFADLAAREKAWAAFGADPDWQKVRAESVAKSGEIVRDIQVTLYRATPYSPVR